MYINTSEEPSFRYGAHVLLGGLLSCFHHAWRGCISQPRTEVVKRGDGWCFAVGRLCCSQYNQQRWGWGSASCLLLLLLLSAPFRSCHAHPVTPITKAITYHTASQDCQQGSGQMENIHPSSPCTATQPTGFTAPSACLAFCSPGGSQAHRYQHTRMKEPYSLVEYLGLQFVRQEGVSGTGNTHPAGSGWLRTAPLPSART